MLRYDVLIVGAGPAGCAAAYDLALAGRRVLLLERRSFPRRKACACGLTRKTLRALRYSVEPVIERTCKEIVLQRASSMTEAIADPAAEVRVGTRHAICAMAVRERFDSFCLQQTLAAGTEILKIEAIRTLREEAGHVALEVVRAEAGVQTSEMFCAPLLIGADGSNGQTRRLMNGSEEPEWYERGFALEALVPYTALPQRLPAGEAPHDLVFDFAPVPGGYGWLFPKADHINIGVGAFAPSDDRSRDQATVQSRHEANLKSVTRMLLAGYTQQKLGIDIAPFAATTTGQHLGMGGHRYTPRGRVLLAGDAAGLVDPLTGEGIHSAVVSGQAAAAAILSHSPEEAAEAAAEYARRLAPLQQTLEFSRRAARAFYADPARGFRAMRTPVLRSLVLKTYAEGLPHTKLLTTLSRLV